MSQVEDAIARAEKLQRVERQLAAKVRELEAERAELEAGVVAAGVAARVGDGEADRGEAMAALIILQQDTALCRAELDAIRQQRPEAARAVYQARAAERRADAMRLRDEADALDAECAPHLAALQAKQGVAYAPQPPAPANPGDNAVHVVARSEWLRRQADMADMEARAVEGTQPPAGGMVDGERADDLVEAACYGNPLVLGPTEEALRAFVADVQAREQARRAKLQPDHTQYLPPAAPVRLRVAWANGALDPRNSEILPLGPRELYALRRAAGRTIEEAAADLYVHRRQAEAWESHLEELTTVLLGSPAAA